MLMKRKKQQKVQIPLRNFDEENLNLPGQPNEAQHQASRAMMSYPLGKPSFPEDNKFGTKSIAPEVIDIKGKQPIGYYIDLAKQQPGKKLAFISKRTGTPRMGITYDGRKVMISSGGPAMELNYLKEGKLNRAYIDKIYSHNPPKFTQKDLPPDVEFRATTYYSSDDDEDPDKAGKGFRAKRKKKNGNQRRRRRRRRKRSRNFHFYIQANQKMMMIIPTMLDKLFLLRIRIKLLILNILSLYQMWMKVIKEWITPLLQQERITEKTRMITD